MIMVDVSRPAPAARAGPPGQASPGCHMQQQPSEALPAHVHAHAHARPSRGDVLGATVPVQSRTVMFFAISQERKG